MPDIRFLLIHADICRYMPIYETPPTTNICLALQIYIQLGADIYAQPSPALPLIYVMHILPPVKGGHKPQSEQRPKSLQNSDRRTLKRLAGSMVQIHYRDLRIIGDEKTNLGNYGNMLMGICIYGDGKKHKRRLGNLKSRQHINLLSSLVTTSGIY